MFRVPQLNVQMQRIHQTRRSIPTICLFTNFKVNSNFISRSDNLRSVVNLYFRKMADRATFILIIAYCKPMQLRGPPLNGKKQNGCRRVARSGKKWSGLNTSASSPQISGRWKCKYFIYCLKQMWFRLDKLKLHLIAYAMQIENGHHDDSMFRNNTIAHLCITYTCSNNERCNRK